MCKNMVESSDKTSPTAERDSSHYDKITDTGRSANPNLNPSY